MLFFNRTDINDAVAECRQTKGAVLIDVREADEFRAGHIPGAVNIPLSAIADATLSKDTPLFLYCLRGSRSSRAARILKKTGYGKVRSIGGIIRYKGPIKKQE